MVTSAAALPPAPEHELTARIRSQLGESQRPHLKRLQVAVNQGRVTLTGSVGSFYEKQLAIHTCQQVLCGQAFVDAVTVSG